jgi:uncharacterized protein YecA (UPF0149 family)
MLNGKSIDDMNESIYNESVQGLANVFGFKPSRLDKEYLRRKEQPRNELCNCGSGKKFKKCCGR